MFLSEPCKQCGLTFHTRNGCGAKNAECNKCRQVGHFGRTCVRADRSNRKKEFDVQRKKQRDRRRMSEFMARKDAMNLPFYNLSESELATLTFNSSLRRRGPSSTTKTIRYLEGVVHEASNSAQIYKDACDKFKQELQIVTSVLDRVQEEKQKLLTEFHVVNKDLEVAKCQETSMTQNYIRERKWRAELQAENKQMKNLKCSNEKLTQKIVTLEKCLSQSENETKEKDVTILNLRNKLSISERNIKNHWNYFANTKEVLFAIREDTENKSSVSKDQDGRMCGKCGSNDRVHPRYRCPAKRHLCQVCDKRGHFPIFCTFEKHFIDPDSPLSSKFCGAIRP